jgi:hypothetical protein
LSILPVVVVWSFALAAVLLLARAGDPTERRFLLPALALQFVASAAQYGFLYVVSDAGDAFDYVRRSDLLRDALRHGDTGGVADFLKLLIQADSRMADRLDTGGGSTRSFSAMVTLLRIALADSMFAVGSALGIWSFFGRFAAQRAMRRLVPELNPVIAFWAWMGIPSLLFWTGSVMKESAAVGGLGLFLWGASRAVTGRASAGSTIVGTFGFAVVWLTKAFQVVPVVAGLAAWLLITRGVDRGHSAARLLRSAAIAAVAPLVVVLALGAVVPEFSLANFVETTSTANRSWVADPGASTVITEQRVTGSLSSMLAFAPLGLANALFRPTVLDASNPRLMIAAIETSVLTFLALLALARSGPAALVLRAVRSPGIVLCLVVTFGFAFVTGVTTPNLGSLSRYRVPMLPFYFVALWVLGQRAPPPAPSPR